jgi:hypothetical protein
MILDPRRRRSAVRRQPAQLEAGGDLRRGCLGGPRPLVDFGRRRGLRFGGWLWVGNFPTGFPIGHRRRAARAEPSPRTSATTERTYPLGMVLSACPDIVDYAKGGIANWRDLLATAAVVRPMLGISPSAWEEAQMVMGETEAAVVVACLLQRSSTIQSAGGYLRELTRKAGEGEFSLGPILMAQINARNRERRSA